MAHTCPWLLHLGYNPNLCRTQPSHMACAVLLAEQVQAGGHVGVRKYFHSYPMQYPSNLPFKATWIFASYLAGSNPRSPGSALRSSRMRLGYVSYHPRSHPLRSPILTYSPALTCTQIGLSAHYCAGMTCFRIGINVLYRILAPLEPVQGASSSDSLDQDIGCIYKCDYCILLVLCGPQNSFIHHWKILSYQVTMHIKGS